MVVRSILLVLLVTSRLCDGQTSVCSSGETRSSSGTITSPNYPSTYYNNLNCSYSVSASGVSSISFTINDLNLESGSNCVYDWVEISCRSHSVDLPVRYCGTASSLAPVVFAPCTQAVVRFKTDGSATFSGFSLNFRVTSLACADSNCTLLYNSFGFVCNCRNNSTLPTAPPPPSCRGGCNLYTSEFTPYPFCYCSLNRQQQMTTSTTCSPGCFYDYDFYGRRYCRCLQTTSQAPCPSGCVRRSYLYGGTYCDCTTADRTSTPCPFGCYSDRDFWGSSFCNCPISTQPPIWCSPGCTSDVNVYGERYCRCPTTTLPPCYSPCYYQYNNTYTYQGPRYCYCPTTTTPPPPTGCDSSHSNRSGFITSPNYPRAYTKGIDCYQYITVPMATSMTLQIIDINIYYSYSYSCYYEYLEITGCDNSVITLCTLSNIPTNGLLFHCIYHTTTTIRFHSYSSSSYYYDSYRGFKLSYQANFVSNCSETSSYLAPGSSGVVSSPNFPGDFPGHSECFNYLFTDDDETLVKITFEQLRLEDSRTCRNVFLHLSCHDDVHVQNETICGTEAPRSSVIFDCKSIRIWFKSNASNPFSPRYFKLRYFATRRTPTDLPVAGQSTPPQRSDGGGVDPWKVGMVLGAGVGGFLFIVLIVLVVVISLCYRRQMARQEQRHLAELTAVCSNLRNNTCGDGSVTFSATGRRENAADQYNRLSSVPPPYASGEAGGGEGRGVGGISDDDDGLEAISDETMLLA